MPEYFGLLVPSLKNDWQQSMDKRGTKKTIPFKSNHQLNLGQPSCIVRHKVFGCWKLSLGSSLGLPLCLLWVGL